MLHVILCSSVGETIKLYKVAYNHDLIIYHCGIDYYCQKILYHYTYTSALGSERNHDIIKTLEPARDLGRKTYLYAWMGYATVLLILPLSTRLHREDGNSASFPRKVIFVLMLDSSSHSSHYGMACPLK